MTTCGTDPEFIIVDEKGRPVPAHAIGIGDKTNPITFPYEKMKKAFRDGYAVEVNVNGGNCRAIVIEEVKSVLRKVVTMLPAGYSITTKAAFPIRLHSKEMKEAPDDVLHFGCDPSYDAYTQQKKYCKVDAATHPWRYAGGHLHFGVAVFFASGVSKLMGNPDNYPDIVKLFDRYIGVPLAFLFDNPEQWRRRKLYGQAGEYRPQRYNAKTFGVEYRVPPPEIFNHQAVVGLFMGVGRYIINNFAWCSEVAAQNVPPESAIIKAINTGRGAEKLLPEDGFGFYTPDTMRALKAVPDIHRFDLLSNNLDAHAGWYDYALKWNLPLPAVLNKDMSIR